jgi:elongation factor P
MLKASELKKSMVVDIDGIPFVVKQVEVRSPSSRGAVTLYKVRFSSLKTGQKVDQTLKGDDFLKETECARIKVQFSYIDGDNYIFMNVEDYMQYSLSREELNEKIEYLTEGLEGLVGLLVNDAMIGLELPSSVVLKITETAPALKGATASSRTKTAFLSTGLEVQVPEYLTAGDCIKVNTETGKYMARV